MQEAPLNLKLEIPFKGKKSQLCEVIYMEVKSHHASGHTSWSPAGTKENETPGQSVAQSVLV